MPDRTTRPASPAPQKNKEELIPTRPSVPKPAEENELMKRLRKVDPDQAKKYRQRSGQ